MADYRGQAALPRGLRDNNPGDLEEPPGSQWQGTVGMDGPFVVFADTTWGLRALARDLITKISRDGLDTIATLINAYAPPSENDTADYITAVAADSGIGAGDQLGTDQDTITSLMRAIVNHEIGDDNSSQYVPDSDILKGYQMANDPTTVFSAAVVAAKSNPGTAIAIGVGVALLLIWMFRKEDD